MDVAGLIMLARMNQFHLAGEGKGIQCGRTVSICSYDLLLARGKYCYKDSCYGMEFVDEFINDKLQGKIKSP